jgi:amidase
MASPSPDWQALAANKRASNYNKIPPGWRLPTEITARFNSSSTESVLDIPLTCGILTPRELDITSNYDATALVQLMAKGN